MSTEDEKRIEGIARRMERFQLGPTMQQVADTKFLLAKVEELKVELAAARASLTVKRK